MYDSGGDQAHHEISRSKPIIKNRVDREIEEAVVKMAFDYPAYGQQRVCNELRKLGLFVSAGGVRSVWQRHDPEVFDKRLKALDAKMPQDGIILTEVQMITLERKQENRAIWGLRIPNTLAISKELEGSISKPLSTLIPGSLLQRCMIGKMPLS